MRIQSLFIRMAIALSIASAILSQPTQADPAAKWQEEFSSEVTLLQLIGDSLLLAGDDSALHCFDPATGARKWSHDTDGKSGGWKVGQIDGSPYALIVRSNISKVRMETKAMPGATIEFKRNIFDVTDAPTGRLLWSSKSLGMYSVVGFYVTLDPDRLLLISSDSLRNKTLHSVSLSTGIEHWSNDEAFAERSPALLYQPRFDSLALGNQAPVFDSDSSMITFTSSGFLRKWNILTGVVIWESELPKKKLSPVSSGFMQMQLSENRASLFVPVEKYLYRIDVKTGSLIWSSPKMWANVYQIETLDEGILVRGDFTEKGASRWRAFMILLDPETGLYKWEKQMTNLRTTKTSSFVIEGDSVVVYKDKRMLRVCIEDGGDNEFAKDIDVRGKIHLFADPGGYRLVSGETVAFVEKDGTVRFNTTYKRPGRSFLAKVGTWAASVAVSVAFAAATGGIPIGGGYVAVPVVKFGLTPFGDMALGSEESICMVADVKTDSDKGAGIVRVRFEDGESLNTVVLDDKNPTFTFSESLSRLYYVQDKSTVVAVEF